MFEGRILDVGCGPRSTLLRRPSLDIVACDISPSLLKQAQDKAASARSALERGMAARHHTSKKLHTAQFVASDILHLPFRNGSADTVIAMNVLTTLATDDFLPAFKELARVSKRFIVFTVRNYMGHVFYAAFNDSDMRIGKKRGYVYEFGGYEREIYKTDRNLAHVDDMKRMLRDLGLRVIKISGSGEALGQNGPSLYIEAEK